MSPEVMLAELQRLKSYYVRRGKRDFFGIELIDNLIKYIRISESRIRNVEEGTKALLLQAAEHVGEGEIRRRRKESC